MTFSKFHEGSITGKFFVFDGVEMLQNECLTLDYNLLTELCSILLKKECRFGQSSLIFEITGWILCNFVAISLRINYRQIFWRNSLDSQQTYVKVFLSAKCRVRARISIKFGGNCRPLCFIVTWERNNLAFQSYKYKVLQILTLSLCPEGLEIIQSWLQGADICF